MSDRGPYSDLYMSPTDDCDDQRICAVFGGSFASELFSNHF